MTPRRTLSSSSGSILVKQIMAIVVSFLVFVPTLEAETRRKYDPPAFSLGQQKFGEKLRYFKSIFPGSACGKATPPVINRHTLEDPDNSGWLTCCIDDPESLKKFSEFRIASVSGQCPVLVHFWKERLSSVFYMVEASAIEQILPDFESLYGPAHRKLWGPDHKLALVSWWYGDEVMELSKVELESDSTVNDSLSKETQKTQETQFVNITMRTSDY
jgi:hypothetical protein